MIQGLPLHSKTTRSEDHDALELLRDAIDSLSEGFAVFGPDHRLAAFNKRYVEINHTIADLITPGVAWEALLRAGVERGAYTSALGREQEWIDEVLARGLNFGQNFAVEHTDGNIYRAAFHPTALGGFVVTRTDITERVRAEATAREGDLLLRKMLDASPATIVMARVEDGKIFYRSPSALELFGDSATAIKFFWNPGDRDTYVAELRRNDRVDDYRLELRNAMGERFHASVSGRIAEYGGEQMVVTATLDLTAQIEAQALIRQVLEACPVPIQMTRASDGTVLFLSPETRTLFGPADSSRSYYADPAARAEYLDALQKNGSVTEYKAQFINARGHTFWGAVSSRLIRFRGEDVIVSHTRDMTGQLAIQDELAAQRELLFQNEKMSALGELLSGVAHELNNPLSVVVGHSMMLSEQSADPEIIRQTGKISAAAERCARIVKTFLAMARQEPARMEDTDINAAIVTAADVAGYGEATGNVTITCKLDESLPHIRADADQITQVILNLVLNAAQEMSRSATGSRIIITTRALESGESVEIAVADDGPGIPDAIKGRIFEPFFTTKDVGEGTGIGLAFCYRTIRSHGGRIWLDQSSRDGSRFCVNLPAAPALEPGARPETEPPGTPALARVLVVDDEPDVAELTSGILKKDGWRVDTAHSASEAISLLERYSYDALLSDLNMPGTGGRGLFEAVRRDFPHLLDTTGFITGDTMGAASKSLLEDSGRPVLEKPASPNELRAFARRLLSGRG